MVVSMATPTLEAGESRWPLTLVRRGEKVPSDGTIWWQELPDGQTAQGLRDVGYEVVDVVPTGEKSEARAAEPASPQMRESCTSLRLYLSVSDDAELEALSDRIADLLIELGFNAGGEDGSLDAVIACVPETDDVKAWAEGPEEFFASVKDDVAFLVIPSNAEDDADEGPASAAGSKVC